MLEPMFDQELVTRNEILRNRREAAKEVVEKFARRMLLCGEPDSKILRYLEISPQELEAIKQKVSCEEKG